MSNIQNQQPSNVQSLEESEIDIKQLLFKFLAYWPLFVLIPILTGLAGHTYLRYQVPTYQSRMTLLINDQSSNITEEALLSSGTVGGGSFNKNGITNEIQILKSKTLMIEVAKKLELDKSVLAKGRVKNSPVYYPHSPIKLSSYDLKRSGVSFNIEVLNDNKFKIGMIDDTLSIQYFDSIFTNSAGTFLFTWDPGYKTHNREFIFSVRSAESVGKGYASRVSVNNQKGGSVLNLSLIDPIQLLAPDILNTLVEVYEEETITYQSKVEQRTLDFIEERLLLLTPELTGVERNIANYTTKNVIEEGTGSIEGLYATIAATNNELLELELQKDLLKFLEDYLLKDGQEFEFVPISLELQNAILTPLLQILNEKINERDRLKNEVGNEHIVLKTLEDEISKTRIQVLESIKVIKRDLNLKISKANTSLKTAQNKLGTTPRKERELLEIQRQQTIKENLYLFLLQKREETALALATAVPDSRVIDKAEAGGQVSPNRTRTYILSILLGFVVVGVFVVIKEFFREKIYSEEDIKMITNTPILGGILEKHRSKGDIVVTKGSRSGIAEMFRLLRTNLQFISANSKNKMILTTSSMSGEGKTFIVINLGMSIALSKKKTILIGLDLRKPKLARYLGVEEQGVQGMSTYLVGEIGMDEIIKQTDLDDNLYYITSGPIPPNPAELIMNDKMKALVKYLEANFDTVIFDMPPVGLVADALLMEKYVSASLFVTRFGVTKRGQIQIIDDIYKNKKLPNPAVILNGIKTRNRFGYGYGYGYGNGYSYGYGYGYGNGYGYYKED